MAEMTTILVWPANATVQRVIRHPLLKDVAFPDDISQPVQWPYDSFTMRMIRDGDVLIEAPTPPGSAPDPVQAKAPEKKAGR